MRRFSMFVTLALGIAATTLPIVQAKAQSTIWDHNGSLMRLEETGKKRRFIYEQPRENLRSAGVKKGTVLFDGEQKTDGRLAGYAKLFRKGCDPVDYFVEGPFEADKGEILLQGQVPIYSGNGCKITGYSDDSNASSLKFVLQSAPDSAVASATTPDEVEVEPRPSYLPPLERGRSRADITEPEERDDRRGRYGDRNTADRGYSSRDYADRRERFGRDSSYDGTYYNGPRFTDEPEERGFYSDYYDDDFEEEEPAYVPYQPRWRRFRD